MSPYLAAVHDLMLQGLENRLFTGAVLLVDWRRETVFHQAYGTVGSPEDPPVTLDTLFDLASLTKVLVTTPCWMIEVGRSPQSLDRPLREWLPEAPVDKAGLTPRLLLAHCSGLPAWRPYYLFPSTRDCLQLVRDRILHEHLAYKPATHTIYSDLGFMVLAALLEESWGMNLALAAKKRVFEPLGLADHLMFQPDPTRDAICFTRPGDQPGAVHDLNARALNGISGHAGLFGTAYGVWGIARDILQSLQSADGLFTASVAAMFCRRAGIVPGSFRALGFEKPDGDVSSCGRYFSPESIGHTGFTGTSLWIDPTRSLIVVLLTNRVYMGETDMRIKEFRPLLHDTVVQSL